MRKKKLLLIFLFIVLIILFIFATLNFTHKLQKVKEHKDFFNQPESEQNIEDWMSLMYVQKHYNIDVNNVLGVDLNVFDKRNTIANYCNKENINCSVIIDKLNNVREKNINITKYGN